MYKSQSNLAAPENEVILSGTDPRFVTASVLEERRHSYFDRRVIATWTYSRSRLRRRTTRENGPLLSMEQRPAKEQPSPNTLYQIYHSRYDKMIINQNARSFVSCHWRILISRLTLSFEVLLQSTRKITPFESNEKIYLSLKLIR